MLQYGAVGLRYSATTGQQRAGTRPAIQSSVRATRRVVPVAGFGS